MGNYIYVNDILPMTGVVYYASFLWLTYLATQPDVSYKLLVVICYGIYFSNRILGWRNNAIRKKQEALVRSFSMDDPPAIRFDIAQGAYKLRLQIEAREKTIRSLRLILVCISFSFLMLNWNYFVL